MKRADLIVAPATPAGRGAVGIIRVSGPGTAQLVGGIVGRSIPPRIATLCAFRDDAGRVIDQGLALYFEAGRSYTGEEMLELQGHGGPVVQSLLLRRCLELGARLAQPGEFTQRAFLNDRLDLSQAEAVADLIDAQSEMAVRGAVRSLQGELSARSQECVQALVELRSLVEASMDFPEEGLDFVPDNLLAEKWGHVDAKLSSLLRMTEQGKRLREGATLALVGKPNVGKSSLLNRLAQEEIAIVSDIPGTTRDVVRQHIVIEGLSFEILDTAGLRESEDPIEQLGMDRTRRAIEEADLVLHVTDVSDTAPELPDLRNRPTLRVINKIDTVGEEGRRLCQDLDSTVCVSARTGAGMNLLRSEMVRALGWAPTEEGVLIARTRHLSSLREARESLMRARRCLAEREVFAEELRLAQEALSGITGEFTSDDLLGEIFSKFCIGK